MDYKHGVETTRSTAAEDEVVTAQMNVQVVVGTAPINLLKDPSAAVNTLICCNKASEIYEKLGTSTDYSYTLMQAAYAVKKFGVAPVIFINVLDPSNVKHVTAVASQKFKVEDGVVEIPDQGILLKTVIVSNNSETAESSDYVISFNDDGGVVITFMEGSKFKSLKEVDIAYTKLKPSGVTASDIIGGEDETGKLTGISLVHNVCLEFPDIVPGIILAPGFSENPAVAAALESVAELSGDIANAEAIVDIESSETKKKEDVGAAKEKLGVCSRWITACWPKVLAGGSIMSMSPFIASLLQRSCIDNNNFPVSPDNKDLGIEGTVLADGTKVLLKQKEANNYINQVGVVTAISRKGWKAWGSNTTRYPMDANKPNERFIKNVMFNNYIENLFKIEYMDSVGKNASIKLIQSVVENFNRELNANVPAEFAGVKVVLDKTASDVQAGRFKFNIVYADYTPVEHIEAEFIWSAAVLNAAFEEV